MKRPRRNHSAEFKARIAREALRGVKTVAEIARENAIHPVQVSGWKKDLEEHLSMIFERKGSADERARGLEERCERLERMVGQLVVEKEYLQKKCRQLGLEP
jgi:transposase-like protein